MIRSYETFVTFLMIRNFFEKIIPISEILATRRVQICKQIYYVNFIQHQNNSRRMDIALQRVHLRVVNEYFQFSKRVRKIVH